MPGVSPFVLGARWPFWLAAWAVVVASALLAALPASAAVPGGLVEVCGGSGVLAEGPDYAVCPSPVLWWSYTMTCETGESVSLDGGSAPWVSDPAPCSWFIDGTSYEASLSGFTWTGWSTPDQTGITWGEGVTLSWLVVLAWVAAYALRFLGNAV